ncbi:hypothetical protein GCM10027422_47590 [Hymenobacter arcticus]
MLMLTVTLEKWKYIATIVSVVGGMVGLLVTAITLIKWLREYTQQVTEKRSQLFLSLRKAYNENESFQNILEHLHGDGIFPNVKIVEIGEFMGFFEELAVLVNSGLISEDLAGYFFGLDVVKAWNNDSFWSQSSRDDRDWSLLKDFVEQMSNFNKTFVPNQLSKKLRL